MAETQSTKPSGLETPDGPRGDQELVDEAAAESFPASDPPSWTPTHVGTPSRVPAGPDVGHELRARLRANVDRLVTELRETGERADFIACALLDAGHAVTRYPMGAPREGENIELEVRGTRLPDELVIVGARYDGGNNEASVAVLLALARALAERHFARTVRIVAFADSAPYAARLAEQASCVTAMLSLDIQCTHGRSRDVVTLVSNYRSRPILREVRRAFRAGTGIIAHGVALPGFLPFVAASDHGSFWKYGYRALMVRSAAIDCERLSELIPGLAAAVAKLAGTRE